MKQTSFATNDASARALVAFFEKAQIELEQQGEEDAAHYMEMCADWIRSGGKLSPDTVNKALGL